jgi:hypothetical protein
LLKTVRPDEGIPRWLWWSGVGALAGAILFVAILLVLSLAGVSDPQPLGEQAVDVSPQLDRLISVEGAERRILLAPEFTVALPGTVEVAARQSYGLGTAGYGFWWGADREDARVVGVNADGYFGVFAVEGDGVRFIEDWHRFPHVAGQGEVNRLRVDLYADGRVVVWINDERAAEFADGAAGAWLITPPQIGFYVETFDEGGAAVDFERLQTWQGEVE